MLALHILIYSHMKTLIRRYTVKKKKGVKVIIFSELNLMIFFPSSKTDEYKSKISVLQYLFLVCFGHLGF